jgi:hypothetical protein
MIGAALGMISPVGSAILHNGTTVGLLVRALRGLGDREPEARSRALPREMSMAAQRSLDS